MNKKELKDIILLVLREDGMGSSAGAVPANVTPNVGGYQAPFGAIVRRKKQRSKLEDNIKQQRLRKNSGK